MSATTGKVLQDVQDERDRQDAKWGDQSMSYDGTGASVRPLREMGPIYSGTPAFQLAYRATNQTDVESRHGGASMASILLEEVFEALAESDAIKLRTELVQVAAVAVAWCEYIDRRGALPVPMGGGSR
ncbi:hypothetical protein [Glaciibacter superstes]|uniref:hypothetical protein n=1 Tax=Glaciibacter superstes TaxID=501023 RepID=UPI0003B4AB10|nr:hypothetical protein [Glaciibacter superstes]